MEFLPVGKDTAEGAVNDARPDCWGERVIRVLDKPPHRFLLAYLFYAGTSAVARWSTASWLASQWRVVSAA